MISNQTELKIFVYNWCRCYELNWGLAAPLVTAMRIHSQYTLDRLYETRERAIFLNITLGFSQCFFLFSHLIWFNLRLVEFRFFASDAITTQKICQIGSNVVSHSLMNIVRSLSTGNEWLTTQTTFQKHAQFQSND